MKNNHPILFLQEESKRKEFTGKLTKRIPKNLPKNFTSNFCASFYRYFLHAAKKTPRLYECTSSSIQACLLEIGSLGLYTSISIPHAYLVPFGKEATVILGYQGMIELLMRSPNLSKIEVRAIYKGDEFKITLGTTPSIHHVPSSDNKDNLTHVYAIVFFKDGTTRFEVMTKQEVNKIKLKAKSQTFWDGHYDQMALKTVVRRIFKYMPKDSLYGLYETALELDNKEFESEIFDGEYEKYENPEEALISVLEKEGGERYEEAN